MSAIEQRLKFITDKTALRKAQDGIKSLVDDLKRASSNTEDATGTAKALNIELEKIARKKALDGIAREVASLRVETGSAESATNLLNSALESVGANEKEIASVASQYEKLTDSIERAAAAEAQRARETARAPRGVNTDRFDQVSQNVSLAGDAESNLRAVSGAIGFAGGGQLEQGLNIGAEALAVTEALPRLKESLAGLPATAQAAAQAMGTTVPAAAGLGVALAALAVTFSALQASATASEAKFRSQIDSQVEAVELAATLSEQELLSKKAQLEEEKRIADEQVAVAQTYVDGIEQSLDAQGVVARQQAELNATLGIGKDGDASTALSAARGALDDTKAASEDAGAGLDAVNIALQKIGSDGTGTAQTATASQNSVAQSADNAASAQSNLASAQSAASSGASSVGSAYQSSASAAQSASSSIESAASSSETAASTIGNAFESLVKQAERSASGFKSGLGKAQTLQIGKSRKSKDSDSGSKSSVDSAAKDAQKSREKINNAQQKFYESQQKATDKYNSDQLKAQRKLEDDLQKIRTTGRQKEADALRSRNFLALAQARESTANSINERNIQSNIDQRERMIAFNEQRSSQQKQLTQLRDAEQQKLKIQQDSLNQQIKMAQSGASQLGNAISNALANAFGRGGGRSSGNKSGGSGDRRLRSLVGGRKQFGRVS